MKMCILGFFRSCLTFAPTELLFEQPKGFFDLLAKEVMAFQILAR
jgi:hypothetical protein